MVFSCCDAVRKQFCGIYFQHFGISGTNLGALQNSSFLHCYCDPERHSLVSPILQMSTLRSHLPKAIHVRRGRAVFTSSQSGSPKPAF